MRLPNLWVFFVKIVQGGDLVWTQARQATFSPKQLRDDLAQPGTSQATMSSLHESAFFMARTSASNWL